MEHRLVTALELKVPPVAIVFAVAVGMWLLSRSTAALRFAMPGRVAVAVVLAGMGFAISAAGVMHFRRAKTTVNPLNPEAATAMVTSGIYRFSRNPMYLGFLIALTGWAAFLSHVLAFALLPVFVAYMNRFQIMAEERALAAKFGRQFSDYRNSVRRWV
jgi:protein-S-isoprenylcysteine O-methyltransferase Ste14